MLKELPKTSIAIHAPTPDAYHIFFLLLLFILLRLFPLFFLILLRSLFPIQSSITATKVHKKWTKSVKNKKQVLRMA